MSDDRQAIWPSGRNKIATRPTVRCIWASAAKADDDKTHSSYYTARIAADEAELAALTDAKLYPGMPVVTMIVAERRTLFDYLVAPFNRTFARSMHEY